jgi:opacity protein-like surface antigen
MRLGLTAAIVLSVAAATAGPAGAGDWLWGGGVHASIPTGTFDEAVDEGWGAAGHLVVLPAARPYGLRLEVSALVYGSRRLGAPLPSGGYEDDALRVDTWFGNMLTGPELRVRHGAVRPYAHALAGLGYFATTVEPAGHGGGTTSDDVTFAWAAGGGVEVGVSSEVSIDVGVRYLANGSVDYLTSGTLAPGPGSAGPILVPYHGEAHVVAFTVGIAFGR